MLRERVIRSVEKGYSHISINQFSSLLGFPSEGALKMALDNAWTYDQNSEMLTPIATGDRTPMNIAEKVGSKCQMHLLANCASFLEN